MSVSLTPLPCLLGGFFFSRYKTLLTKLAEATQIKLKELLREPGEPFNIYRENLKKLKLNLKKCGLSKRPGLHHGHAEYPLESLSRLLGNLN